MWNAIGHIKSLNQIHARVQSFFQNLFLNFSRLYVLSKRVTSRKSIKSTETVKNSTRKGKKKENPGKPHSLKKILTK